jgi:hypothetical protein
VLGVVGRCLDLDPSLVGGRERERGCCPQQVRTSIAAQLILRGIDRSTSHWSLPSTNATCPPDPHPCISTTISFIRIPQNPLNLRSYLPQILLERLGVLELSLRLGLFDERLE